MRILILGAAAAVLLSACARAAPPAPTAEQTIERGRYLVEQVVLCGDCHTPMTANGPDQTRKLHGADIPVPPELASHAPRLAGIPANFTEEQFISFIQTGVRPDGTHPRPPMPPYRLNEEDARAVAAYIASLPKPAE